METTLKMSGRSMIDPTLPFIDLHRHLDGGFRLETILELGKQHGVKLPGATVEELRPHVQVTEPQPGLMAFLDKMLWLTRVLADGEACRRIARENVEDAKREGIDYLELRFSPWFMAEPHGLDPREVIEGIVQGIAEGVASTGLRVNLIGILSRTYGAEIAMKELEALLAYREHFVALDLAGDEANYPAPLFVDHFAKARDAGWRITIHAGEAGGAQSVWDAVKLLGAERIGHCTRALEDPALVDFLLENRIPVEANLTSNVHTSTVPDLASHPLETDARAAASSPPLTATIPASARSIFGMNSRSPRPPPAYRRSKSARRNSTPSKPRFFRRKRRQTCASAGKQPRGAAI